MGCPSPLDLLVFGLGLLAIPLDAASESTAHVGRNAATCSAALTRYLAATGDPENQALEELRSCDLMVVPSILEAAHCSGADRCPDHWKLAEVLRKIGPDRARAAPALGDLALGISDSDEYIRGILGMIAALEDDGLGLQPILLELRAMRPQLRDWIDQTLLEIGASVSGEIFQERLRNHVDSQLLRAIAIAGPVAMSTGPQLVELLSSTDWELRRGAAMAIGFVGFQPAVYPLMDLLEDPADVRLQWVILDTLGRLAAQGARPAVERVANRHWLPLIRAKAQITLAQIEGESPWAEHSSRDRRRRESAAYRDQLGERFGYCLLPPAPVPPEPALRKLRIDTSEQILTTLAYEVNVSFDPIPLYRPRRTQVPDVALRVEDGWIAGSNRGEWGGELLHVGDDGQHQLLSSDNTLDIFRVGDRLIAITEKPMREDGSQLQQLTRSDAGHWVSLPWRALPARVWDAALLDSGELWIGGIGGISVVVNSVGQMRTAPCVNPE